jgi:1-acyl-sn-glycerol-3-phosphate acyltransferase
VPTGSASQIDRAFVVGRLFPLMRMALRLGYFTFDIDGREHVPREGRAVYTPNHAGWFALDAFILGYAVGQVLGPEHTPHFATHDSALATPGLGPFLRRCGALPASLLRRPERLPRDIGSYAIFPEGSRGNTKPFWQAYRMRDWSRGFVRLAAACEASIIPVAILGGEESMPVAWQLKLLQPLIGSQLGLPLSLLPLPTRWRVVFHEPVELGERGKAALTDHALSSELARDVQRTVQATLDRWAPLYPLALLSTGVAALRGRGKKP